VTKMNDQLPTTPDEVREGEPLAASGLLDALVRFLENHGEDFLSWRDGCIVVETYYDKKFRALGGDTNRLISFFEDYRNMHDAARHYISESSVEPNTKATKKAGDLLADLRLQYERLYTREWNLRREINAKRRELTAVAKQKRTAYKEWKESQRSANAMLTGAKDLMRQEQR